MTKISIDIDTETGQHYFHRLASHKPGLLSSISVPSNLETAFANGFGSTPHGKRDNKGYGAGDIKQGKKDLLNTDGCDVIATVGGNVVFEAIKGETDNPNFVSLFGEKPKTLPSTCLGGVSLNSWKSNADRIGYLTTKMGCTADQIGLYYNPNSAMSSDEVSDWDANNSKVNGKSSATPFSGATAAAGASPPGNDPSKFDADFAPAGTFFRSGVKVVIINADPFFQVYKERLIKAANNWLTGNANRYVCYPLQDYQNVGGTNTPTTNRSTTYGPSLTTAYRLLGFLAWSAINYGDAGFFTASDIVKDL
jgi:hypothetical protein